MDAIATLPAEDAVIEIPLDQLHDSPFNPRKTYTDIEQLAADMKSVGYNLQPALVRPRFPNPLRDDIIDGFEVVFGHRRRRGAAAAGLPTLRCMVKRMSNAEARRAQISENLARADVHPIEEAEGFEALMRQDGVTADQLAEQTGKSKSYVYGRLKLLQACPEVRDACVRGEIGSETALLIARLRTPKLQAKALKYIEGKYLKLDDGGKKSFRAIRELLLDRFSLQLKDAIFNTTSAELLPDAGSCTDCPKRTGNAPEFQDVAEGKPEHAYDRTPCGADVCTDPDCWDAKKAAHLKLEAAELEKTGRTVVTGNAARAAVGADGLVKGAYIAVKDVRQELRALKGKQKPETLLIQDPRTGEITEAVRRTDAQQAGLAVAAKRSQQDMYAARQREREEQEAKLKEKAAKLNAQRMQLLRDVRDAACDVPVAEFDMRLIAAAALQGTDYTDKRALAELWGAASVETLIDRIETMTLSEATQLARDCALMNDLVVPYYQADKPAPAAALQGAAAHYGVTPAAPAKAAPAKSKAGVTAPMYRCPDSGKTWTGRGLRPKWVTEALENGKCLDDLRIAVTA